MLLLAPGPVPIARDLAELSNITDLPYFRGEAFAKLTQDLTEDVKLLFHTRATPLTVTASGTGLMEMALVNLLNQGERVVVLNGGNFGQKWVHMCQAYRLEVAEFKIPLGRSPDLDALAGFIPGDATALLINAHETSTGYLFDLQRIGEIVRQKNLLYIVDGVSAIGADAYRMDDWGIDCSMVSSQKALACMPGIGFIAFSDRARERFRQVTQPRCYFDALDYANNVPRGMVPFTPAMVAMIQVKRQLEKIRAMGPDGFVAGHRALAGAFRERISADRRLAIFPERPSNALTAFTLPPQVSATRLIAHLKTELDWWLAPNPTKREDFVRVSHMGDFTPELMIEIGERIPKEIDRLCR